MIPKFATHLLQLKSHGTHHIRNVLQSTSSSSLPWSGVGSSSSSWGSSTGAGGAKFNAGSRFYAGYTGPGRVITQATSLPATDGSNGQVDDSDERNQGLRPTPLNSNDVHPLRRRRSSIGLLATRPHLSPEPQGQQQTSAIHSQAKHAFMLEDRSSAAADDSIDEPVAKRARRNSTSALDREPSPTTAEPLVEFQSQAPAQTQPSAQIDLPTDEFSAASTQGPDEAVRQSSQNTSRPASQQPFNSYAATGDFSISSAADLEGETPVDLSPLDRERYDALKIAKQSGSVRHVMQEILRLRQSDLQHSLATYNMALLAVNAVRTKGMPIAVILELYNEMLENNLTPNYLTYSNVIRALCDRDLDIHEMLTFGKLESSNDKSVNGSRPGKLDTPSPEHVRLLQDEENFASAMALFNAARALRASHFAIETYNVLLRSAGFRGDMESAIRVYSHLEGRSDIKPNMATYGHLISVYAHARDMDAAQDIFDEFRNAAKSGDLHLERSDAAARRVYMQVYNRMISAYFQCGEPRGALALLEEMLGTESKEDFVAGDVPAPSASTFTEIIAGFCDTGDLDSAVKWFERLLQSQTIARKNDPYAASKIPLRPDREAWLVISHHLTAAGQLETLQQLLSVMIDTAPHGYTPLEASDIADFLNVNTAFLYSQDALENIPQSVKLVKGLKAILPKCALVAKLSKQRIHAHEWTLIRCLIRLGELPDALSSMNMLVVAELEAIKAAGESQVAQYLRYGLQRSALEAANDFMGTKQGHTPNATLNQAFDLLGLVKRTGISPNVGLKAAFVQFYQQRKSEWVQNTASRFDWLVLTDAFLGLDRLAFGVSADFLEEMEPYFNLTSPFPGVESLLEDFAPSMEVNDVVVDKDLVAIYHQLASTRGREMAVSTLEKLGLLGREALRIVNAPPENTLDSPVSSASDSEAAPSSRILASENETNTLDTDATTVSSEFGSAPRQLARVAPRPLVKSTPFRMNFKLSSMLEAQRHRLDDPIRFFQTIVNDARRSIYVTPSALSLVISALGRVHELEKARQLYGIAQTVLATLESDKVSQTRAWFAVEDAMVCAHAFASDMETANLHRARMIEQGGAPSAEAYAVLILTVNDFTDDCNVALGLYNEAISLGVVPNVFLYNNIISKLSKARKAETALEIFQDMKKSNVRPTSVTYGALVGACCRVGDADTAMYLFSEMSAQANFRPKAPPFNTMIQFFVHTKPDRDRALHYYNLMVASNVPPSAHTYKLLMDAYGLIEPVDMSAVEIMFDQLVARQDLEVQGNHWASLITAWGCSCKDVERASAIFDSIPAHPTTIKSGQQLPDAQTWEAFINVLVTQHRFDLLGPTLENLRRSGVHMTAYIANVVIRGYASSGDIEQARLIFESMQDPPEGMAASFNHLAPYSFSSIPVSSESPVYREPSTYEAMIRAEMGVGERERATSLLQRMEARHFPPAVEARIRGLVNQSIQADRIPDFLDLQGWYTGAYALDLKDLPAVAAPQYGPMPVDGAMYLEATA
ncbi:hypothetical protein CALVIDRAFT_242190 [Calocera viscosa TUFC12733]|uniref:Pentacotripeptide-repeat region of PRORP domain-containing protein n=1 Tax=Calocera viscosa (strain TUFC12733) TaxID=1330018 RepID=A0A167JP82_CALVF|nr:hypothetical protein CALVIDRAFT_242190 [Calocera viscosa TUFC12733]